MNTLWRLTVANVRSLLRDRAALFWAVMFPIMFVLLFGAIFSGSGSTKITVGFVNEENNPVTAQLQSALDRSGLLTLQVGNLEEETQAMKDGKVSAVIVIPKGLLTASGDKPVSIVLYIDPTKTQINQIVQSIAGQGSRQSIPASAVSRRASPRRRRYPAHRGPGTGRFERQRSPSAPECRARSSRPSVCGIHQDSEH